MASGGKDMSETNKYTLWGALFGCCFPVFALMFVIAAGETAEVHGFFSTIAAAHAASPLLYIIDTAPLFLGLFARLAGARQDRIQRFSEELEQEVERKTESLRLALEESRKANEMIAYMAEHDALTGLLNRHRFQKELEHWTSYALRYQRHIALMFIDLDNFKEVNDNYGHSVGDEYLVTIGSLLRRAFRTTDFLARWGGDEFAILLPETNELAAMELANKTLKLLNQHDIEIDGRRLQVSGSIGIAVLPTHCANADELVTHADTAMYEAKDAGRNRWRLYSDSPQETEQVQESIRWEARIRRALETDQFVLLYQPLMNLNTRRTTSYEALLRMEDREGQLISPAMFLKPAERFQLSRPIDRMVIRKAANRIAGLSAQGDGPTISVNLSRDSLADTALVEYVREVVEETGIRAERLGFEGTESLVMQNIGATREMAPGFRELGCKLILDDFGVGYTSLQYLQKFDVAMIKIDGSLIRDIKTNAEHRRYVRMLTSVARELNIETVAKFVEDEGIIDLLVELGVDYAQGFAIGRPLESIQQELLINTRN